MTTPNYFRCKGFPNVIHTDNGCNGDMAIDGDGWVQLPIGLGFDGIGFRTDAARYSAYKGFCMKCKAEGLFIRTDKKPKLITKRPKLKGKVKL